MAHSDPMLQEAAPIVVLQWQAWSGITDQPVHLRLVDFFPADIQPDVAIAHGSPAGLLAVTVPQWGLTVLAHRKASDDHICLIGDYPHASRLCICHCPICRGLDICADDQRVASG